LGKQPELTTSKQKEMSIEIKLDNRKALVGGSTQGIGKAIAMQLAAGGATVTLMARNEDKLKKVLTELPCPQGQKHNYLVVDFSETDNFKKTISAFLKTNPVNILINNTQGPVSGGVLDKTTSDYQTAFELLFQTVCHTTMEALPFMKSNGFGRIINVSSVSVKEPLQHLVLSNSLRSAVISWAKTLANDVAKDNITVNNILTGYFDTDRIRDLIKVQAINKMMNEDELRLQMQSQVPMKRFGKPEEYGYLVAFLASDKAAYITGTNIPIDGGLLKSI
jgi:3-oxoacyl-[acyl-carrier protein] reductase